MKKSLFLLAFLCLSVPAWAQQIAGPAFSSHLPFVNPAVVGFGSSWLEISGSSAQTKMLASQLDQEYPSGANQGVLRMGPLFAYTQVATQADPNQTKTTRRIGLGLAMEGNSLAGGTTEEEVAGNITTGWELGLSSNVMNDTYLGIAYTQNEAGAWSRHWGIAGRGDQGFGSELTGSHWVSPTGGRTWSNTLDTSFQWNNRMVGYRLFSTIVPDLTKLHQAWYLGWEPEIWGISFLLEGISSPHDFFQLNPRLTLGVKL